MNASEMRAEARRAVAVIESHFRNTRHSTGYQYAAGFGTAWATLTHIAGHDNKPLPGTNDEQGDDK